MPYYFMRDTPLQALEQLMMSQPGQKPRGGGIYRSPFHYTPKDVACEYCQNYDHKHSCRLYECTCLEERIEAGVLEMNEFVRDCFAPSMGPQFRKRMHQQLRERNPQFFLSNAHRRRWTYWRERCDQVERLICDQFRRRKVCESNIAAADCNGLRRLVDAV